MKRTMPLISGLLASLALAIYGGCAEAATATNLVTICTSAKAVTQASKCTAWQYNYYSPTAYIESFPQVSPGPANWTDPAYEYRLGSTITPTMGVKVCPAALTPGTSFTSAAADPCPKNLLVSASTVLGGPEYAISVGANGIEVTQNWNGTSAPVAGSPFVENPLVYLAVEQANPPAVVSPSLIALDPAGTYLYAYYNTNGFPAYWYSYAIQSNGSLKQIASLEQGASDCAYCPANLNVMTASAHYIAVYFPIEGGEVFLISTRSGVMSSVGVFSTYNYVPEVPAAMVTSIQIDASERWMYVNYSSTGGTVPDTSAVFSMQQLPTSLGYVSTLPVGVNGIQIVPTH